MSKIKRGDVDTRLVVTVFDPVTNETHTVRLSPAQHVLVCTEPAYLDSKQIYGNGTVQLTLKRRGETP